MRTQVYNINMQVGAGIPPIVKVSQYDELRVIGFRLFDGARAYFPGENDVVTITGTKPSGLGFSEECSVNGSIASVETTLAMTQESGHINAELRISDGSTNIGTANFVIYVEPAPHPAGTTDGTTEEARTVLEQCAQYAQEAHEAAGDVAPQVESLVNEAVADKMEEIEDAVQSVTDAASQAVSDINAAGEAVEESIPADYTALSAQVSQLQADLNELATFESYNPIVDLKDYPVSQGYLNTSDGSFTATSGAGSYQRTTDPIALNSGVSYTVVFSGHSEETTITNPRAVCVYRNDDSYSRYISIPIGLTSIELTGNESYIRINYNAQTVDTFNYYPTGQTEPINTTTLNEDVVIPQTETLETEISSIDTRVTALEQKDDIYIGARRCAVGFIIDGDYDQNAIMENAFYSKGVKIGFALPYTTLFQNNSKDTYLEWQEKGHEILAHTSYTLTDGDHDDEVAKGYIKSAYTTLTGYGFNIYGLIGSSGKIADKYIPTVRKYFRYCASENNHSGSYTGTGAEPCLYFGTNAPFHLWRYSMQTSTLQQMKDAVDRAIDTTGLLLFYGHAQSANNDNFTVENVNALLDYIASKAPDISIMTPSEAINEFYTIRYDDVVTS